MHILPYLTARKSRAECVIFLDLWISQIILLKNGLYMIFREIELYLFIYLPKLDQLANFKKFSNSRYILHSHFQLVFSCMTTTHRRSLNLFPGPGLALSDRASKLG